MSVSQMTVAGQNWAKLAGMTPTTGNITAVGTVTVFDAIADTKVVLVNSTSASDTQYVNADLDQGVQLEIASINRIANVDGGVVTIKTGSSGGAAEMDQISFTTYVVDPTTLDAIRALFGLPVIAAVGLGWKPDGTSMGTAYLAGKLEGNIERATQGQSFVTVNITVTGYKFTYDALFDETDINTALGTAVSTMGGTFLSGTGTTTPTALTTAGYTDFIKDGEAALV